MARITPRSSRRTMTVGVLVAATVCGGAVAPTLAALPYGYGTTKPEYFFNVEESSAAQTVRSWFAAWMSGDPLLLAAFVDQNVIFRSDPADEIGSGRENLLKKVCGSLGDKRKLIDLFVIGGDYDSSVITRWEATNAQGNVTHMGSFFRVQKGLVVEWYDVPNDPVGTAATKAQGRNAAAAPAAARNAAACQAVDAAFSQPVRR